jgi:hypothetical protein
VGRDVLAATGSIRGCKLRCCSVTSLNARHVRNPITDTRRHALANCNTQYSLASTLDHSFLSADRSSLQSGRWPIHIPVLRASSAKRASLAQARKLGPCMGGGSPRLSWPDTTHGFFATLQLTRSSDEKRKNIPCCLERTHSAAYPIHFRIPVRLPRLDMTRYIRLVEVSDYMHDLMKIQARLKGIASGLLNAEIAQV